MKQKVNQASILLDQAGLKKTDSRVALLDLLLNTKKPLSVKEIFSKISGDKVTIYRILETMNKKGLIRTVDTGQREARYEIIDNSHDHHHVICLDCKKVSDFTGCDANNLITKALKQVKDFKLITHHSFDLFGICNACSSK